MLPKDRASTRAPHAGLSVTKCSSSPINVRRALSPLVSAVYGLSTVYICLVIQSNYLVIGENDEAGNEGVVAMESLILPVQSHNSTGTYVASTPKPLNYSQNTDNFTCSSAAALFETYGLDNTGLNVENFTQKICPTLMSYSVKNCHGYQSNNHEYEPSTKERYGYGTLAVAVISVVPLLIFLWIPKPDHPNYRFVMQAITALAVSTLLSDTFLHLIPLSLELKKSSYTGKIAVSTTLIKGTMTLIPIYFLYILEMIVGTRHRLESGDLDVHGHSHNMQKMDRRRSQRLAAADFQPAKRQRSVSDAVPNHLVLREESSAHLQSYASTMSRSQRVFHYLATWLRECIPKKHFGWMIILGDTIHNVMDGIALGAAFSNNPISGLSTSIAVLFHEVPHEVGDFVALMTSGVSWRGAMTWQIVSTAVAFMSLYIGIGVSTDTTARQWVFAFTAGIFLHHALTEFLPELQHIHSHFWRYFALQNIGILSGFGVVIIITIFEDALHYSVRNSPYLANVTKT